MARTTIDYGIDLGTTNSAVAVLNGVEPEIVKNGDTGSDTTPSAVRITRNGALRVGLVAKDKVDEDPDNTAAEFKSLMGTSGQAKVFEASGRTMEPHELSAEVLKSLRSDVRLRTGEDITAAVITVPAAFELHQTNATRKAAELAGLSYSVLIQEPTAAALAHGFQLETGNRFWLVYDLGGGTFDAAVVHLSDGELTVVNHSGDNDLGGKLVDWAIVQQLLIPAVTADHPLHDFRRGVKRWNHAMGRMKRAAEWAKINLSRHESTLIEIDHVCDDDRGENVELTYTLTRSQLERLTTPLYARSLHRCRQALKEARLGPDAIEKVLLVGGPSLDPHLRDMLRSELGVELDHSQDPLTVVARGAAVFAATQQPPQKVAAPQRPGQYTVTLEYDPVGADTDPFVGGTIVGAGSEVPPGLTVEIEDRDAEPPWRSGRVPVGPRGTFLVQLYAKRGRRNVFWITLTDSTGEQLDITPEQFHYTVGAVETQPLLPHTVGLGLANNELLPLVVKGTPLKARKTAKLRTVGEVRKGSGSGLIRIPVLEGDHERADRNRQVAAIEVHPRDVRRDVPAGSAVEVTVEIDASRIVSAQAFVPVLDEHFKEVVVDLVETAPDPGELQDEVASARARYHDLRQKAARADDDAGAADRFREIEEEGLVEELVDLVESSVDDSESAIKGARKVGDLQAELDDVETRLRWPELVQEAEEVIEWVGDTVSTAGTPSEKRTFTEREREVRAAIASRDVPLLERRRDDLRRLGFEILDRTGLLQLELFNHFKEHRAELTDPLRGERLIAEGERAIGADEVTVLRNVNQQLSQLLPQGDDADPFSTVMRDRL